MGALVAYDLQLTALCCAVWQHLKYDQEIVLSGEGLLTHLFISLSLSVCVCVCKMEGESERAEVGMTENKIE